MLMKITWKRDYKMNIELLKIEDYSKCSNIWNMKKQSKLAEQFLDELKSSNRVTYIYKDGDEFIGEISLVKEMNDLDYTIPNQRVYVSRLIVKKEYRCKGIGKKLVDFITDKAKELGYSELSIGVDLDNYPALKLYIDSSFDKVIYIGEDEQGQYVKLLKTV